MRFWRVKAQDEGVRTACDFLKLNTSKVTILDLLSNEITPLGNFPSKPFNLSFPKVAPLLQI